MNNTTTGQTMFYQTRGFNYGWICPICGKVYSPTQIECYNCNKKENSVTTIYTEQYGGEVKLNETNRNN